jgi:hypothetical protein
MIYLKAALYGLLSAVLVAAILIAGAVIAIAWYEFSPPQMDGAGGIGAVSIGVSEPSLLSIVLAFVCSFVWTMKNGDAAFTRLGFATLFKAVLYGAVATAVVGGASQYLLGLVLGGLASAQTSRDEVTEVFVTVAFISLVFSLAAYGLGFVWSLKRSRERATRAELS